MISYPFVGSSPLEETIPMYAQSVIVGIMSEGVATMNTEIGWIGGLTELSGTKGYLFLTNEAVSFSYNPPVEGTVRQASLIRSVPLEYSFKQSTQQAFYFVNSATIDGEPLDKEDLIIAYNGDVIVGSRYWYGKTTDIPTMGSDGSNILAGYCTAGDKISFKVWDESEQKLIDMGTDGETTWQNLGLSVISLTDIVIPEVFKLEKAYPNPFNPKTTLYFSLPIDREVSILVYNLQGREIASLVNGNMEAGYHSVIWNADNHPSGMYFVKMISDEYISTQKLLLIK